LREREAKRGEVTISVQSSLDVEAQPSRGLVLALLDSFEEIVAGAALVIVVLSVCWGVITRYLTEQPATWSGEVAAIGFAWLVFVGASAGFKHRMHVSIDMLVQFLPARVRLQVDRVLDIVVVAFCAYVAWLGVVFTAENWDNPTSVLRLPMSIVYAAVTLGFAMMTFRYAQTAWPRWRPRAAAGS
jgi:TRAP-type C4-dicarboxylate transport system permease small subunit